eukprot:1890303-Karenia_brevis.AAC.1
MATLDNMKAPGKGEEPKQRGKGHKITSEENPQMREAQGRENQQRKYTQHPCMAPAMGGWPHGMETQQQCQLALRK